ncbi:MAG: hypothetical protein GF330_02195 [Candidatus Eisenbacteria bacterium]|nr:hypothetical protein [Candidatus Eisenbacteria bacterium]
MPDRADELVRTTRVVLGHGAWFGLLLGLLLWRLIGGRWALGFGAGTLLGMANLLLLGALAREVVRTSPRRAGRIAALLAVKIPLIYGGLAALILLMAFPPLAIVCGFSLVLVIVILRAAGRALLESGLIGGAGRD